MSEEMKKKLYFCDNPECKEKGKTHPRNIPYPMCPTCDTLMTYDQKMTETVYGFDEEREEYINNKLPKDRQMIAAMKYVPPANRIYVHEKLTFGKVLVVLLFLIGMGLPMVFLILTMIWVG
jgi:hypothetical protein